MTGGSLDLLAWGLGLLAAAWLLERWLSAPPGTPGRMVTRLPLRITPGMIQPRGERPPPHDPADDDPGRRQLTADAARRLALIRLAVARRHVRDRRRDDGGRD